MATQILAIDNAKLIDRGLLLKAGTVIDATLIAVLTSTKKAHIGADAESVLVHTVTGTAANKHDITQAHALLHGQEDVVFADSGYRGITKREEIQEQHPGVNW